MTEPQGPQEKGGKYLLFIGLGTEIVGLILAAVWLGGLVDEKMETKGLFLSLFSFAGLIGWMIHILVLVKKTRTDETPK